MIVRSGFAHSAVISGIALVITQIPAHYTSSLMGSQLWRMLTNISLRGYENVTSVDFYSSFTNPSMWIMFLGLEDIPAQPGMHQQSAVGLNRGLVLCCSTFAQLSLSVHRPCWHTSNTTVQVIHDLDAHISSLKMQTLNENKWEKEKSLMMYL